MSFIVENILDLVEISGEDKVMEELSAFSCPQNKEIEDFLKHKAIEFAKQKLSVTYLVSDEFVPGILGYFTLAVKAVEIKKDSVSKSLGRKINKYSLINDTNITYIAVSFLLAQFGKNYEIDNGIRINGVELMDQVEIAIHNIQHMIGMGLIILDVEKGNQFAFDLYSKKFNYKLFRERESDVDGKVYNVMNKTI